MRVLFALFLFIGLAQASEPRFAKHDREFGYEHGLAVALRPILRELKRPYYDYSGTEKSRVLFQIQMRDSLVQSMRSAILLAGGLLPPIRHVQTGVDEGLGVLTNYLDVWQPILIQEWGSIDQLNPKLVAKLKRQNSLFEDALPFYLQWAHRTLAIYKSDFAYGFIVGMALNFGMLSHPMQLAKESVMMPSSVRVEAVIGLKKIIEGSFEDRSLKNPNVQYYLQEALTTIAEVLEFWEAQEWWDLDRRTIRMSSVLLNDLDSYIHDIYHVWERKSPRTCAILFPESVRK